MRAHVLRSLALSCALLAHQQLSAGEDTNAPRPRAVSPAVLPKGTPCQVRLLPGTKVAEGGKTDTQLVTYEGTVAAATDRQLTLIVAETYQALRQEAPGARLPVVGRLFSNHGIRRDRVQKTVTIAAEKIQSITLLVNPAPGRAESKR